MRRGLVDWAVLAALTLSWGSAFAALRIAVHDIHPLWNTAIRLVIATLVLGAGLVLTRKRLPPAGSAAWRWYALSGIIGMALPFALFAFASTQLASAVTAICNGGTPIFVAAMAHLFAGEKLTGRRALGVLIGFAGLAVLVGADAVRGFDAGQTPALLAALGGAALYAVSSVSIRRAPPVPAITGALLVCGFAACVAVPVAAAMGGPFPAAAPARAWGAAVFLGLIPSAVSMIAWVWLLARRGAVFASMGTYGAPLVAMAIGMVWLGERPGPEAFIALALVIAGMLIANLGSGATDKPGDDNQAAV